MFPALLIRGPALDGTAFLGMQSEFGDKPFNFQVLCPLNERDCSPKEREVGPSHCTEKHIYISIVVVFTKS